MLSDFNTDVEDGGFSVLSNLENTVEDSDKLYWRICFNRSIKRFSY